MTKPIEQLREALANSEPHPGEAHIWRARLEQYRRDYQGRHVTLAINTPIGDPERMPLPTVEIGYATDLGWKILAKVGRFGTRKEAEAFVADVLGFTREIDASEFTEQTVGSSQDPPVTWAGILAAIDKLGPRAPRPDEYEVRVSEWCPKGQVVTMDMDATERRLEGISGVKVPRPGPRWNVLLHPEDARGRNLDELAVAAIIEHQRRGREHDKQWHPFTWGHR